MEEREKAIKKELTEKRSWEGEKQTSPAERGAVRIYHLEQERNKLQEEMYVLIEALGSIGRFTISQRY